MGYDQKISQHTSFPINPALLQPQQLEKVESFHNIFNDVACISRRSIIFLWQSAVTVRLFFQKMQGVENRWIEDKSRAAIYFVRCLGKHWPGWHLVIQGLKRLSTLLYWSVSPSGFNSASNTLTGTHTITHGTILQSSPRMGFALWFSPACRVRVPPEMRYIHGIVINRICR